MTELPSYRFRLRWQFEPARSLQDFDGEKLVVFPRIGHCKIKPIAAATENDGQSLALTGPPVDSKELAMKQGEIALGALLQATLRQGYAVLLHPRRPEGVITQYGMEWCAQQLGGIDSLYRDRLGITIFEERGETRFVSMSGGVPSITTEFVSFFAEWTSDVSTSISLRNLIAYDLYSSSRFESSSRARFLLLVMAIESLAKQDKRAEDEQALITQLLAIVEESALDKSRRTALKDGLRKFRNVSIGESCRILINEAFVAGVVEDPEAARHFRDCYRIRGQIVHSGKTPQPSVLSTEANRLEKTVRQLVTWALQQQRPEQDELWSSEFTHVMQTG